MTQRGVQNNGTESSVARIVAIGASAGGIHSLRELLPHLPLISDCCILVVVHLAPLHRSFLPQILGRGGSWTVKQAQDGETIRTGVVYIAPPDLHLVLSGNHLQLLSSAHVRLNRPSVDVLFKSVAEERGTAAIGVLLSGAGRDGSEGLRSLKKLGAWTIVQDPDEALFPSMPFHGIETGCADFIMQARLIAPKISSLCSQG
ncbi:MAG TPA: chemotaxis protein CheB [Terriglobales bacterium]|nr:chemotaxis protein CheB [Terriglobales bacterium]